MKRVERAYNALSKQLKSPAQKKNKYFSSSYQSMCALIRSMTSNLRYAAMNFHIPNGHIRRNACSLIENLYNIVTSVNPIGV